MGRKSENPCNPRQNDNPCKCSKCVKKINKVCREEVVSKKKIEHNLTREIMHVTEIDVYPNTRIAHKYKKVYLYHPEKVREDHSDCEKVDVQKCDDGPQENTDENCASKKYNNRNKYSDESSESSSSADNKPRRGHHINAHHSKKSSHHTNNSHASTDTRYNMLWE